MQSLRGNLPQWYHTLVFALILRNAAERLAHPPVNGNWTYTYDDFDRIAGSNQNNGQSVYSYNYDQYGNRWNQTGPFPNPPQPLNFTHNNNRIDGYTYDAAGNLLSDGVHSYSYDAESRIMQVDGNNQGTCSLPTTANYVYNASGDRVRKTTGSTSVDYLYDLASHEIIELSSAGVMNRGTESGPRGAGRGCRIVALVERARPLRTGGKRPRPGHGKMEEAVDLQGLAGFPACRRDGCRPPSHP